MLCLSVGSHLTSRVQVGSPVTMRLVTLPPAIPIGMSPYATAPDVKHSSITPLSRQDSSVYVPVNVVIYLWC